MSLKEEMKQALEHEYADLSLSIKNNETYIQEFIDSLQAKKDRLSAVKLSMEALKENAI